MKKMMEKVLVTAVILLALFVMEGTATAQLNQPLHQDGWISAAAHAPGLHGSIWRTDIWIYCKSGSWSVDLYFGRSGQDNTDVIPFHIEAEGGAHVLHFEDVVEQFLEVGAGAWVGSIHYTSDFQIQVWARVYSISPDGRHSYGQVIQGIPTADMSPDVPTEGYSRVHQHLCAMKHTADGRFRVNIGILNPTGVAAYYRVEMFGPDGNYSLPGLPSSIPVEVPPYSMMQLSDPFAAINGGDWDNAIIQVLCDTVGAGTLAYASVVDNNTNDAYFTPAFKVLSPDD